MRILTGLLRILIGFAVACLVAGAVTAAFVITPSDVAALPDDLRPERLNNAGVLSLLAATHSAIFSFPFALLVIGFGEWRSIRSWLYYVIAGIVIALGGFAAEYMIEAGTQPSIANDYAARAYLTIGFAAGLAYWLVAGRLAGARNEDAVAATMAEAAPVEDDDEDEPEEDDIVVEPDPKPTITRTKPVTTRK
jgi:hypothetical protein